MSAMTGLASRLYMMIPVCCVLRSSMSASTAIKQVHVLGKGAMGCLFAARLQRAGVPVTMVVRDKAEKTFDMTIKVSSSNFLSAASGS